MSGESSSIGQWITFPTDVICRLTLKIFGPSAGPREGSGSVVECLTGDQEATGSSLTGVTVLCP